jgi:hypothetical protein
VRRFLIAVLLALTPLTRSSTTSTGLHLHSARTALRRAQKATQESFAAYTASLETERRVSHEVAALEDRRDHLCNCIILRSSPLPPC